ncbi:hypothetical protein QO010_000839 [Caulobacter ginsengisoli]|uniref:DUF2069 domain-containing protein n=1 Tax=Caulobacter ginsengisoli TaxID=400775 RepID=A0ABU0IM49_9CAUL|nr:hypothetical protein [Caulobacter ginsengisoli]MDQ0463091.1 hypothetical protein [Caulobacter ginsengisoli]
MELSRVRWIYAVLGAVLAEVALIAAAILWVTLYSYVIRPGLTLADYQTYAEQASPWVSVIAGLPVFFLAGRWARGRETAIALFAIYLLADLAILLSASPPTTILLIGALGYLVKALGCWLGARSRGG